MLSIPLVGRAGASPPSRTAAIIFLFFLYIYNYIYLFIYLYPCRTSCPKSSTCFFFSDISIFLRRKCYTRFVFSGISIFRKLCVRTYVRVYICTCTMSCIYVCDLQFVGHGFVRHRCIYNVGVAVLVGKCMQGPCSVVPDIRSMREYGNFPNS